MMSDSFIVTQSPALSTQDISTLAHLYLPLIKPDGLALYLFLSRLVDEPAHQSMTYPISFIYDSLSVNPERFLDVRKRLEGAQLLKTYDSDLVTFVPLAPLKPEGFFNSPLLAHLKTHLPKERIADLKMRLLPKRASFPKKSDISASFESTFGALKGSFKEPDLTFIASLPTIDINDFLSRIPTTWIPESKRSEALKSTLSHLAYVYNLDESRLKTVIEQSLKHPHPFEFDQLSDQASTLYVGGDAPQTLDVDAFKKMHPADVLKMMTGSHVPASELKIVDKIIRESGLKLEVISVLIAYVITELNGQMPVYKYFEKVSGQWHRNGIATAEMAVAHIKTTKQKKSTAKTKPKEAATIDWFKDYLKEKDAS